MSETIALPTAGLMVIQQNKLLLAFSKNQQAWYLPGGKVDKGETSLETIKREILEELNLKLQPERLKFYAHLSSPAFGEEKNVIMEQDCFLYELIEELTPSNEIEAIKFFDLETYLKETHQVAGALKVYELLKKDGLIK